MIQALPQTKSVTFEEFVQWKPEGKYYELHNGVVVEISQPPGDHEDITGFLNGKIILEYIRLGLSYGITKNALLNHQNMNQLIHQMC
jgi:Uma2 family endonuclease